MNSEGLFKFVFAIGILLFCLLAIGVCFLIIKIILMFMPQVHFMGLVIGY